MTDKHELWPDESGWFTRKVNDNEDGRLQVPPLPRCPFCRSLITDTDNVLDYNGETMHRTCAVEAEEITLYRRRPSHGWNRGSL